MDLLTPSTSYIFAVSGVKRDKVLVTTATAATWKITDPADYDEGTTSSSGTLTHVANTPGIWQVETTAPATEGTYWFHVEFQKSGSTNRYSQQFRVR